MTVGWFILDNYLIVYFNLNTYHQSIFIMKDGKIDNMLVTTVEELPEQINNLCKCHKINNVKLKGISEYLTETANQIKEYATLNYSNNELNIEILED